MAPSLQAISDAISFATSDRLKSTLAVSSQVSETIRKAFEPHAYFDTLISNISGSLHSFFPSLDPQIDGSPFDSDDEDSKDNHDDNPTNDDN